jgi:transcriptional regulator GlxA family with amidase domain
VSTASIPVFSSDEAFRPGRTADLATDTSTLIRLLVDPGLSMPAFLACAAALRMTKGGRRSPEKPITPTPRDRCRDARVMAALGMLELAAAQGKRLKAEEIARSQGVHASHLGRLVSHHTGFDFTEWRTAFLLRPALAMLADTNEHVKQIGCRLLGFSDKTQFTHEFSRLFGLSPTEFRRISLRR